MKQSRTKRVLLRHSNQPRADSGPLGLQVGLCGTLPAGGTGACIICQCLGTSPPPNRHPTGRGCQCAWRTSPASSLKPRRRSSLPAGASIDSECAQEGRGRRCERRIRRRCACTVLSIRRLGARWRLQAAWRGPSCTIEGNLNLKGGGAESLSRHPLRTKAA